MANIFKIPLHRLTIDTPELYNQLVNGEIGVGYKAIYILPGAHPNILTLPKLYANHTIAHEFRFEDDDGNVVILENRDRVEAILIKGENLTLGLPIHYKAYKFFILHETILSSSDFDYISQWKMMTWMKIDDSANIAYDLSTHTNQMKSLKDLRTLRLKAHPESYRDLKVKPFLEHLSVWALIFDINEFTLEQAEEFMRNQEVPNNYESTLFYNSRVLQFSRRL